MASQQRILVVGGAGLIGSSLCRRLIGEGHIVVCLDNAADDSCRFDSEFKEHRNLQLVHHNAVEPFNITADRIYFLASPPADEFSSREGMTTLHNILAAARNTLEVARTNKAPILFGSSCEVYGNSRLSLQNEEYYGNVNPLGTRAPLEEGKRAAETMATAYRLKYSLDVKIARIFNTYGADERHNSNRVINRFIVNAIKGDDMVIYGNGQQTRSFCHVSDTVDALVRFMSLTSHQTFNPINIGHSYEISIGTLAEKIHTITASTSKIVHLPALGDEVRRRCPDITKARQLLDWYPTVSLDEGVRTCIEAVRKNLSQHDDTFHCMSWIEMN